MTAKDKPGAGTLHHRTRLASGPAVQLYVSFLPPYSSHSTYCTAVQMIEADLVLEVPLDTMSGILLSPEADQPLSAADLPSALERGIHLIDGHWELLHEQAEAFRERGIRVRRLPAGLEPFNPYYRRMRPRYFFSPERFSTSEAAAYALAVLGLRDQGLQLATVLGFRTAYESNLAGLPGGRTSS